MHLSRRLLSSLLFACASVFAGACAAPTGADDVAAADLTKSIPVVDCAFKGELSGKIKISLKMDTRADGLDTEIARIAVSVTTTAGQVLNTVDAKVERANRSTEDDETPGVNGFGENYEFILAKGSMLSRGSEPGTPLTRMVLNATTHSLDLFGAKGVLIRRQEIGSCGFKNSALLKKANGIG
jgi:hypothetical protein